MRYFQPPPETRFYAGVDLHARSLFLAVLDRDGQTRYARNLPAAPQPFLRAVTPFRDGIVVGCECMHCWYGLADTCREHDLPFALGHAFGMHAVHQSKTKCDRHDAEAIARLLKGGNFPLTYPYPRERPSRLGKPKALAVLAHKLGRAFYHMLRTKEVFDIDRFLRH